MKKNITKSLINISLIKNGELMKNLTTLFFALFLTSMVFAQSVNVQPI